MAIINIALGQEPKRGSSDWIRLEDGAAPATGAKVIVSLARLKADDNALFSVAAAVGVELTGFDAVEDLAPWIDRLGLVDLRFTVFKDGRLFTSARLLRERLKYRGELRAVGDILPDQVLFLLRSGVSSLEVADTFPIEAAARTIKAYSVRYQHAADSLPVAFEKRY